MNQVLNCCSVVVYDNSWHICDRLWLSLVGSGLFLFVSSLATDLLNDFVMADRPADHDPPHAMQLGSMLRGGGCQRQWERLRV